MGIPFIWRAQMSKESKQNVQHVIEQYELDIERYRHGGQELEQAKLLRALGELYARTGELVKSRQLFTKAIMLYDKKSHHLGKAYALFEYGHVERESNRQVAKRYFVLAANLFQLEGNQEWYERAKTEESQL